MGELAHIGFAIRRFEAFLQDWSSGLSSGVVEARTGRSSGGYLCQPTLPPLVPAAGKGPPVPLDSCPTKSPLKTPHLHCQAAAPWKSSSDWKGAK